MDKIDGFEGRYAFLSNFYPSPVEYISLDGQKRIAASVEHAFQASKAIELRHELAILNSPTMGALSASVVRSRLDLTGRN